MGQVVQMEVQDVKAVQVGGEGDRVLKKQHSLSAHSMCQALLGTFCVILISAAALSLSSQHSPIPTSSLSAPSVPSILTIHGTYKAAQHPSSSSKLSQNP